MDTHTDADDEATDGEDETIATDGAGRMTVGGRQDRTVRAACPACGDQLGVGGSFCPSCGTSLSDRIAPDGL